MPSIGGNVYVEIAGRQRSIEGEVTLDPGGVTREQAEDTNGEAAGFTERTRNGKMDLTFYLTDGLTAKDIEAIKDKPATITVPSSGFKGRTDQLTCASCTEVNPSKGTAKASFFWPGALY